MDCDCIRGGTCELRASANALEVDSRRVRRLGAGDSRLFQRSVASWDGRILTYEPGKCIKCGKCVAVSETAGDAKGFFFRWRGYQLEVNVAYGEDFSAGLGYSLADCVAVCPTGALWLTASATGEEQP